LQVIYDFVKDNDFKPLKFTVHPKVWAVIAYTGEDADGMPHGSGQPQWRVAYVEPSDLPDSKEEILHTAHERLQRYVRGRKDLMITRVEPYWLHQRYTAQARKGIVLLEGGALHVSSRGCKTMLVY
jgi:hypothetical protein